MVGGIKGVSTTTLDGSVNAVGTRPVYSSLSDGGHQMLVPCLLRPCTQGLPTELREEPSTASSKVGQYAVRHLAPC